MRGQAAKLLRAMAGHRFTRVGLIVLAVSVLQAAADEDTALKARSGDSASNSIGREVDFASEIYPIFEQRCVNCHGSEQQMGEFRLDSKSIALEGGVSGPSILPGHAARSPLVQRIAGIGELNPMPLVGERLSPEQIALVRAWIDQGALWSDGVGVGAESVTKHWAYRPPERRAPPLARHTEALRNPIDSFVMARLERNGLGFLPEASKETLIRRLSLDLRGLPPTLGEVDRFLADASPNAYEKLVERMLKSPHFGEHWAGYWLDLARYADTNGYESDEPRTMWAYRDWVIDAFNRNVPFDRFTTEQLAGDLLPDPAVDQIVATGFHRNTMLNNEAGSKDDEFYDAAVKDRVDTTATVWLGSTLGCAQCHDHKYDPFNQHEYYRMYAVFNNTADSAIKLSEELEVFKGDSDELRRREAEVQAAKTILDTPSPALEASQRRWERLVKPRLAEWRSAWQLLEPEQIASADGAEFEMLPDGSVLVRGAASDRDVYELTFQPDMVGVTGLRLEALPHESLPEGGPGRGEHGAFALTGVEAEAWSPRQLEEQEALRTRAPVWGLWHTIGPFRVRSREEAFRTAFPPESNYDLAATYEEGNLAWSERKNWNDGRVQYLGYTEDDSTANCASYAYRSVEVSEPTSVSVSLGSLKGLKVWLNSRLVLATDPTRDIAPDQEELKFDLRAGANDILLKLTNDRGPFGFYFQPYFGVEREVRVRFEAASADHGTWDAVDLTSVLDGQAETGWSLATESPAGDATRYAILQTSGGLESAEGALWKLWLIQDSAKKPECSLGRFRLSATTLDRNQLAVLRRTPLRVRQALGKALGRRSEDERRRLAGYYRSIAPELDDARRSYSALRADLAAFRKQYTTTTLVMRELPEPRETRLQNRGNFLDLADKVEPGVPAVLDVGQHAQVDDRLALARWLMADGNPLTARVRVNQIWNRIFGRGFVTTPEDFGTQGDRASHPELLDWLATELIRVGWDTQTLLKTIVTSATYRQTSSAAAERIQKDPNNVLLSRGARYRVPAESVRDIALAVGGQLNRTIGGPSVFPPQPEAVFGDHFIEGGFKHWPTSAGAQRYRRGLYTFYKRTVAYPTFTTFDAPDRTVCTVDRSMSNTPLQALNTLNDPAFFEAAGALAERILDEAPADRAKRLVHGFRLVLARRPSDGELDRLLVFVERMAEEYEGTPASAAGVVERAFHGRRPTLGDAELAPWVMAANVLLNLDETFTRD